jgi:hypothetical protein
MSSPTINSTQAFGSTSLGTIMILARSLVNDTQPGAQGIIGEGQILVDNPKISAFTLPFLMASIREVYRELRNVGDPELIFDNVIIENLPIVNSPVNGPGSSDPAVQTILSTNGYFDGVQQWPNFLLPANMLYPEKLWERASGTNNNFHEMTQVQSGLPSRAQQPDLVHWEWRNNNLNFCGATQNRDIRMRYYGTLPVPYGTTLNFETTYVPIFDCTEAVAYKVAVKYARMLGSPGLQDLVGEAKEQMFQLKNQVTRRMQSIDYHRIPFGNSDGDINNATTNFGFW